MTDTPEGSTQYNEVEELVARCKVWGTILGTACADALEQQARRIAALEKENAISFRERNDALGASILDMQKTVKLEAENAELKEKQKSFCMQYRIDCDAESKELEVELLACRAALAFEKEQLHTANLYWNKRIRELGGTV